MDSLNGYFFEVFILCWGGFSVWVYGDFFSQSLYSQLEVDRNAAKRIIQVKKQKEGTYSERINVSQLPSGLYLLHCQTDTQIQTIKISIVK